MSLTTLFVLSRLLHFGAEILMFGISIFVSLLTPAPLKATLRHRLNLCLTCTITVSLLTTVAILLAQSGLMGNGWPDSVNPSVIYAVLGTTFGQAWLGQLTLASVSALCLFMSPQVRFNIIAGLSTALLINLGFVGHVTINTGLLGIVHRLNHLIHLLSGGYWLGTLIPLLVCLRYLSDPAQRNYAIKTMIKFSNFGHAAVFLVILTGSINTIIILGSWPNDWLSPYQQLLSLKILMVAVMVGIALYNRYILVPLIQPQAQSVIRLFIFFTLSEIIIGIIILSLVSFFATLSPI